MSLKGLQPWHRDALAYLAAAVITSLVAVWVLQLGSVRMDVPFVYEADGLSGGTFVKGIIENGSALVVPRIGAPGISENYEFAGADGLFFAMIYVIGLFARSWPLTLNVFYLLGYPLAAVSAAWSSRRLGTSRLMSVAVGTVYALAPYHFTRGEGHLFLSAYFLVPPAFVLALLSASDTPVFPHLAAGSFKERLGSRGVWLALLCLAIGSSGVYYAAFACFFILAGGLIGWLRTTNRLHLLSAGLLIALILIAGVANLSPSLIYGQTHEPNQAGLIRHPGEPEVIGLKMVQMFLPIDGHRIGALANIKAAYHEGMQRLGPRLDSESVSSSSLGILASLGIAVLLAFAFVASAKPLSGTWRTLGDMGTLTVWAILLATVGGLGTLASFVVPELRAYNRISIYLAFAALTCLALLAEQTARPRTRTGAIAALVVLVAISSLAVLDQTAPRMAVDPQIATRFAADNDFVDALERALPADSMVFQMPYTPYPEPGGPFAKMQDYDPLVGYLHSETLRWSYGAMKGRDTDRWQKRVSDLEARSLIVELRAEKFSALWLDRFGYEDGGAAFARQVEAVLGEPLLESDNGRWLVWRL